MLKVQKRFLIHGKVQGVGFRVNTVRIAHEFSVKGFIRNLKDGSVELVALGEETKIDSLLAKLKEEFEISQIVSQKIDPKVTVSFDDFTIKYE